MADRGDKFSFSKVSIKNWYENWYLHYSKTYDHQIWEAGISTGFVSNATNQASAGDFITSRTRDKIKSFYVHEKINRCLTNIKGRLTSIFKI